MKRALMTGLTAIVLATSTGCSTNETRSGSEYSRVVKMPSVCETGEIIGAGHSMTAGGSRDDKPRYVVNEDWISCKDHEGSVWVYRVNKLDNEAMYYTKFETIKVEQ